MKVSTQEMKQAVADAFVEMNKAVGKTRGVGFGRGYDMHAAARRVAPEWLHKWDDDSRWMICFTQGVDGLEVMSQAFGLERDGVYHLLKPYYAAWKAKNPQVSESDVLRLKGEHS